MLKINNLENNLERINFNIILKIILKINNLENKLEYNLENI